MKTYLISYDARNGDCGCVELPSTLKLVLWIVRRIRHFNSVRIHVCIDGMLVFGPDLGYGGGSNEEM